VEKSAVKGSYERAYHEEVHGRLGDTPRYYELKARQAVEDYFADVDSLGDVFEFGFGKNVARLPRASGFDVSDYACSFSAAKGVRVYASMDDVPREAFDTVLCSHVLEHVEQPLATLELLGSLLRPTGRLVIVLPAEEHAHADLSVDVHQHLFAWTFRTINNLLDRAGFEVLRIRYVYRKAQYKLRNVARVSYRLYDLQTRTLGRLLGRRIVVVVARRKATSPQG
jgi:SAM-dependent methyltransferase